MWGGCGGEGEGGGGSCHLGTGGGVNVTKQQVMNELCKRLLPANYANYANDYSLNSMRGGAICISFAHAHDQDVVYIRSVHGKEG